VWSFQFNTGEEAMSLKSMKSALARDAKELNADVKADWAKHKAATKEREHPKGAHEVRPEQPSDRESRTHDPNNPNVDMGGQRVHHASATEQCPHCDKLREALKHFLSKP